MTSSGTIDVSVCGEEIAGDPYVCVGKLIP